MTALLVLGAHDAADAWGRRLRRASARRAREAARCEAVLVVNDRSALAVDHLRRALDLRAADPRLAVAVLTLVEPGASRSETLARGLAVPGAGADDLRVDARQAAAIMADAYPALRLAVSDELISFEYGT